MVPCNVSFVVLLFACVLSTSAFSADPSPDAWETNATGDTILLNGRVGVGTDDPTEGGSVAAKLTVRQNDNSTALAIMNGNGERRLAINPQFDGGWTMYDGVGYQWTAGISQKAGKVGIGTLVPGQQLHVESDSSTTVRIVGGENFHTGIQIYSAPLLAGWAMGQSNTGSFYVNRDKGAGVEEFNAITIEPVSGKVGIGTTSPARGLHVQRAESSVVRVSGAANFHSGIQVYEYQTNTGWALGRSPSGDFFINRDKAENMEDFRALTISETAGNVAIGSDLVDPSYKLYVNGDAAGTSWTNLSSREFKTDIKRIDPTELDAMLTALRRLDVTSYRYKEQYSGGSRRVRLGFLAEEMPDTVLSEDGKGVDVYGLLALTVGALKAQQLRIEEQQLALSNLSRRLDALKAQQR